MHLWNAKNLSLPPINTYRSSNKDIDIKHLHNVCQELKVFLDNKYLHAEYLVLSRIIYRMKQKFRSAKDLKALEKVNKALEIYFGIGIMNDVNTFMELIPSRYKDETYLPTKSMLDYLLVRFQGLAKLMERVVETCKISAFLLGMRMKTGHFWRVGFISFALVSRVYVLAKYNANQICHFYGKLIPFSTQLCNSGKNWLPHGYVLPKDLKGWMNVAWLDFDDEVQIIETPEVPDIMEFFDLVENDDDDVEFCDEYVMITESEKGKNSKRLDKIISSIENIQSMKELRGFSLDEDVGEAIPIKDMKKDIKECAISKDESGVIYLSDNSVEFVDRNEGSKSSDESDVIVVSDDRFQVSNTLSERVSSKIKKQKVKTQKKKKTKEILEDILTNFQANKNSTPVLNNTYNNKNVFSVKNRSIEITNKQKNNTEGVKRKKSKANSNAKRMKLDFDTSEVKEHHSKCKSKTIEIDKSYNTPNNIKENRIFEKLEKTIGFSSVKSEVPRSRTEQNKKVKKQKKKKKLEKFQLY